MYYTKENERLERISIPEIVICYYFKKYGISYEKSPYFDVGLNGDEPTKMTLDFYIEEFKLAIEYDGKLYHGDPIKDMEKDLRVSNINLSLLRIREEGCSKYYYPDYSINSSFDTDFCLKYNFLKHFNQSHLKRERQKNTINDYDLELINYLENRRKTNSILGYLVHNLSRFDRYYSNWKEHVDRSKINFIEISSNNNFKKKAEETVKVIINFINDRYGTGFDISIIDVVRDYCEIINQDFIIKK